MGKLTGKVALITGGTSGIGEATARLFLAEGATVVATGSSEQSVASAVASLPGVTVVRSNAGNPEEARQLIDLVAEKHGRIDILFVNAGIARVAPYGGDRRGAIR